MSASGESCKMGIGPIGGPGVVFKRKFRWLFSIQTNCKKSGNPAGYVPPSIVKLAARPNLTIEETEINFLNAKMWIPGKGAWETITVTYYDVGGLGSAMSALFGWLATVYDFTDSENLCQSSKQESYGAKGTLQLFDGCGNQMEEWTLGNMWPQAINFGELDYSSSEEVTVELTLRYSEVDYLAASDCGGTFEACCDGCGWPGQIPF